MRDGVECHQRATIQQICRNLLARQGGKSPWCILNASGCIPVWNCRSTAFTAQHPPAPPSHLPAQQSDKLPRPVPAQCTLAGWSRRPPRQTAWSGRRWAHHSAPSPEQPCTWASSPERGMSPWRRLQVTQGRRQRTVENVVKRNGMQPGLSTNALCSTQFLTSQQGFAAHNHLRSWPPQWPPAPAQRLPGRQRLHLPALPGRAPWLPQSPPVSWPRRRRRRRRPARAARWRTTALLRWTEARGPTAGAPLHGTRPAGRQRGIWQQRGVGMSRWCGDCPE